MKRSCASTLVPLLVVLGGTLARAQEAEPQKQAAEPSPAADTQSEEDSDALPAGHEPALQWVLEPREGVRTGELVHLRIDAVALEGDDLTVADQSFAPYEVHSKHARVLPPSQGKQRFVFELALLAFEPDDDAPLPAIELRVVTKDGFVGSVRTPPIPFAVRSWLGNEPNAQPKAPTKPAVVLEDNYLPIYLAAGLLCAGAVAGLTLLLARYLRKRRERAAPPPPPRPPWEVAVEKLGELRKRKQRMLEEGKSAVFVDQLSDVVREYLGRLHAFDGLETTTDEMLKLLAGRGASAGFTQSVASFLGRCDLVKFAKVEPDREEVDLLFGNAQALVHDQPSAATQAARSAPSPTAPSDARPAEPPQSAGERDP